MATIKIDDQLRVGCNECHEYLQPHYASGFLALGFPCLPDMAFGEGWEISNDNAKKFQTEIKKAVDHCQTGAFYLEED